MNMEQNAIQKNMWNTAGKAGLILGLISAVYLFITQFLGQSEISPILSSLLAIILWTAKFAGCIWVMKMFMTGFAASHKKVDNSMTFRLGMIMSLLSAIVFAAFAFANVAFISPELFEEQMNMTMQQMAPMMDSNALSQIDSLIENLPEITFVSNLIYCSIYGTVLSYILSRRIPSKDPFADYKTDEQ